MYEYRDPKYNGFTDSINCEINHPNYGWIPFTVYKNGDSQDSRELFLAIEAAGGIEPYTPPTDEEIRNAMPALSARQFRLGFIQAGHSLSEIDAAIAAIADPTAKATAQVEWEYATTFLRLNPLIVTLSGALGLSDTEVDAMWKTAVDL